MGFLKREPDKLRKEPNEVKPKFTLVLWYCVNNDCIVGLFRTARVVVEAPTNMRL